VVVVRDVDTPLMCASPVRMCSAGILPAVARACPELVEGASCLRRLTTGPGQTTLPPFR
jgi:hypothetical protein